MTMYPKKFLANGFRAGAKLLEDDNVGLCKNVYFNGENKFCAIGACRAAVNGSPLNLGEGPKFPYVSELAHFNDLASTTKEDVIKRLRQKARELEHGGSVVVGSPD